MKTCQPLFRPRSLRLLGPLLVVIGLLVPVSFPLAQVDLSATTVTHPTVSTARLRSEVRPLPVEELKVELDGWLGLLREKAEEVSDLEMTMAAASGQDLPALSKELISLQAERSRLVERVYVVMNAYAAKGGDVTSAEQYVRAVWTLDVPSGARGLYPMVTSWVTSADGGGRALKKLLLFLVWAGLAVLLSSLVAKLVRRAVDRIPGASQLLCAFLANAARTAVLVFGGVIALSHLGVNAAPLAAALGATGFIVGFALKDTLSNYASGVMVLVYRPYDVGDRVIAGGVTGTIETMSLVATIFRTSEGQKVIVPNSKIWSGTITNASAKRESTGS